MKPKITIYTDGACSGNPGPGGYGALLISGKHTKEIYGSEIDTTNNRMELLGAIKAIEALKDASIVDIYTDSKYVQQGISEWINGWVKNNWVGSNKKLVKNSDLWQNLYQLTKKHEITWHWVKGHGANEGNIRADKLAVLGRDEAKKICRS